MKQIKRWHIGAAILSIGTLGALFFQDKGEAAPIMPLPNISAMAGGGMLLQKAANISFLTARRAQAPAAEALDKAGSTGLLAPAAPPASINAPRKIVKNGNVRLEVKNYESSRQAVLAAAARLGAEVMEDTSYENSEIHSGYMSFKVSAEKLDALIAELEKTGKLLNRNVSATDMGEEYVDIKSRLDNLRRVEKRLNELLSFKTNRLGEVLQVERELERVGSEIERLLGRMKYIDALAAASRLTVNLEEPAKTPAQTGGMWNDARNRVIASLNTFLKTGLGLLSFTGFMLAVGLWAGAIGLAGLIIRKGYTLWQSRRFQEI